MLNLPAEPNEEPRVGALNPLSPAAAASASAAAADATGHELAKTPQPWSKLVIAVIDDAMHPPRLDQLGDTEKAAVVKLLTTDPEVTDELALLGAKPESSPEEKLTALARTETLGVSAARVGDLSPDGLRMIEEHIAFNGILRRLQAEVAKVVVCDPFQPIPDLSGCDLVLLDYYLQGPGKGGDLAIAVATAIRGQQVGPENQQIVLMSSIERVRDLRGAFRSTAGVIGSAFSFVAKRDLSEAWKVKAHLGMLERARPYGPAFVRYRSKLEEALDGAKKGLLGLVDDLDIGDYAFLQGHALMKDGHPLGDYVFWLLSAQFMALGFEGDAMREQQRELDKLEFVGEPFASTEPSTVVARLLHSALMSRNVGPLGPHPRSKPDDKYSKFPLVQLGDVFLDAETTKAIVVMSADCDLAFAPSAEREPDAETPVLLVPGTPIKLKEASQESKAQTDGIVNREEVYRIVWEFAKYRAVPLGELETWMKTRGYNVSNRDRLRPLFALKLQQEFGAHLLRVGPPILPPLTTPAKGTIYVCIPPLRDVYATVEMGGLMLTRFKTTALLRLTTTVAGDLKAACDELLARLTEGLAGLAGKAHADQTKKVDALRGDVVNDEFWIGLLKGFELHAVGTIKLAGPLGFVVGDAWQDPNKPRVVLEIVEDIASGEHALPSGVHPAVPEGSSTADAVSEP